jgi:hypothetical protein
VRTGQPDLAVERCSDGSDGCDVSDSRRSHNSGGERKKSEVIVGRAPPLRAPNL